MSGSFINPSVAVSCEMTSLYSRNLSTSGCSSASVFEFARNFAVSPWMLGSAISVISRSYCASTALSLSNMVCFFGCRDPTFRLLLDPVSAAGHRRQKRHLVAIAQRRGHTRIFLIDRARDRTAVVVESWEL